MSSAPLKLPVRDLLDDALPEREVRRLWSRIARDQERPRRARPWAVAFALTLALATIAVVWLLRPGAPVALRLANHEEIPSLIVAENHRTLELDDGSVIFAAVGSRLEVLESTGKVFSVALRWGRAVFDVRPSGPRAWRVDCGTVAVEVVGTRFTIDRFRRHVTVTVERGAVLVRGDAVPDQVLRLSAGKSVTLETATPESERASGPPSAAPAVSARPTTEESSPPGAAVPLEALAPDPPEPGTRSRPERPAGSSDALAPSEMPGPVGTSEVGLVEEPAVLFQAADAARRLGRVDEAARSLTELLRRFPADSRAPLAELTLGRMNLDALGRPGVAGDHLMRALRQGLPAALAEDAAARVVEAYARAGKPELAADAKLRYQTLYPGGSRTEYVNRWAPAGR